MVFSSFLFLFVFLPAALATYYLTPQKFRNLILLLSSYLFYAWGAPAVIPVLFGSSLVDYFIARRIWRKNSAVNKKILLTIGIVINLSALTYYKYMNFFVDQANFMLRSFGLEPFSLLHIALPIGISFFTFQKISYLADVYRGTTPPASRLTDYLLYVALFPQLIAGPIIRYHDIAKQIVSRQHSLDAMYFGICRFCLGLGKKILIADQMGAVADNVFALSGSELSGSLAWLGIVCYTIQIYFDFSGYSDMAIGLGRMFGFEIPENFNWPYVAETFTDFWRRWHISLSQWMKEYLYIPLGGNRASPLRTYINLWTVFLLSGLWHGASWTFVIWGAFHGFFLALDKAFWLQRAPRIPKVFRISSTFFLVMIGWVFFRSESLGEASTYLSAMLGGAPFFNPNSEIFRAEIIHNRGLVILLLTFPAMFLPAFFDRKSLMNQVSEQLQATRALSDLRLGAAAVCCLLLSICALAAANFTPFLYFRF